MLRKLGIAALAAVALGPVLAAPATAVEPAGSEELEAEAPAVARAGQPGDRLTEVAATLPLVDELLAGEGADDDHGEGAASGTLALPSSPEMVILEDVPAGSLIGVRSRNDGTWSPWVELVANPDDAPDGRAATTTGVGPIWIGHGSEQIEVAVLEGSAAEVRVVGLHAADAPVASGARALPGVRASVAQVTGSSFIHPRTDWATSGMGWKCNGAPEETRDLRAMVVHHTATNTAPYAQADVPDIIRGFWRYHVGTNGWCDIAYNFLVDSFGGVWEGRQGGITKAIIGGHTRGFNSETTSVTQIGNFEENVPTQAMTTSTSRIVGWKLGLHGLDPQGRTTLTNRTGGTIKGVANGGQVPVPVVPGHRDLGTTACPGKNTYATLPTVRSQARSSVHLVGIYEAFLGATPDPAAYARWSDVAVRQGLRQAALGLAYSPQYSGVLLDDLYQRVLGRPADAEGKRYWLGVLSSGTRIEDVSALFYGSKEYVAAAGSPEGYVRELYENLLHRQADPIGLAYWSGLLRRGEASPPEVARGFYASRESRLDRVARLYERFLGRQPDRAGQAHWAEELLDVDDIVLAVELSLSDEFYGRSLA